MLSNFIIKLKKLSLELKYYSTTIDNTDSYEQYITRRIKYMDESNFDLMLNSLTICDKNSKYKYTLINLFFRLNERKHIEDPLIIILTLGHSELKCNFIAPKADYEKDIKPVAEKIKSMDLDTLNSILYKIITKHSKYVPDVEQTFLKLHQKAYNQELKRICFIKREDIYDFPQKVFLLYKDYLIDFLTQYPSLCEAII